MIVETIVRKAIMILILGILFSLRIRFNCKKEKEKSKIHSSANISHHTNWKRENIQNRVRMSLALFNSLRVKGQVYRVILIKVRIIVNI